MKRIEPRWLHRAGFLLAVTALAIISFSCGRAQLTDRPDDVGWIELGTGSDGTCQVVPVCRIRTQRQGTVLWKIENNCNEAHTVAVANFQRDNRADDPLENCVPTTRRVPVQANQAQPGMIRCGIKPKQGQTADEVYTYDVTLDENTALDPQLIIKP